jgi:hypothetical protein
VIFCPQAITITQSRIDATVFTVLGYRGERVSLSVSRVIALCCSVGGSRFTSRGVIAVTEPTPAAGAPAYLLGWPTVWRREVLLEK